MASEHFYGPLREPYSVRRLAFFGSENTSVTQSTHSRLLLYGKSLDGKL